MDSPTMERLIRPRAFPPVVHPRHARELLAGETTALGEWTGGYAITVPEHRHLLEDVLGTLAWRETGQAILVNGRYGTGKSHLLVLLHLLAALPAAWEPFLETYPAFRRYARAVQERRLLPVHFSLDEYGPTQALEEVLARETRRALAEAGGALPATPPEGSRADVWRELLECARTAGYGGLLVLVDELSLFLAGRSPARREADAALLQFLAGWTGRAPVWLLGALQRNLADVGALRTHSWRQVEDRFRRYTLSPQQLADVLRDKLLQRLDTAAIRALVTERLVPAAERCGVPLAAGDLQAHWPFHPAALDLLMAVTNRHLSPHRSAVEVVQRLGNAGLAGRATEAVLTPLDLYTLVEDDLRCDERLAKCWRAVALLEGCAETAPDPALARRAVALLALWHLAERTGTVAQMRALLFDGVTAPAIPALSAALHHLRRQGAYLAVTRDAEPGAEQFTLAIDDETGAQASVRMQEMRQELTPGDPRVSELVAQACTEPAWPLATAAAGLRLAVGWQGSERHVLLMLTPALSQDAVIRAYEGLAAGNADAVVLLQAPGNPLELAEWHAATATLSGAYTATLLLWLPRERTAAEEDLWLEYAAWVRAADVDAGGDRRVAQRCRERAAEMRPAVATSLRAVYQEGRWLDARGGEGFPPAAATLAEGLAVLLEPGFDALFPAFPVLSAGGIPSRAACQQLVAQFIEPGEVRWAPQTLLAEYLERFAVPLGIAVIDEPLARVTSPAWETLQPVLALTAVTPARVTEALEALRRPPLGLTGEQARLVLFAAVRVGTLRGLDGFLQPLNPEEIAFARSDALAFIAPPAEVEARYRPLLRRLANRWGIAETSGPLACGQVELRLRQVLTTWQARLPRLRETLAAWTETLQVLPWGWRQTEEVLGILGMLLAATPRTLETYLPLLSEDGDVLFEQLDALDRAAAWWQAHGRQVALVAGWSGDEAAAIRTALARGEESLPLLPDLGERLQRLLAGHAVAYRTWHEELFGPAVVSTLRESFELPAFRAIKLLTRLSLPVPPAAGRCLEALAQARTHYCPGLFARLEEEGTCARCRLPLGSPSPMPDAVQVRAEAEAALGDYATLFASHPWTAELRDRATRAPGNLADRARAVLDWQVDEGAPALLALLDDRLLLWLCRDQPVAGRRRVINLQASLTGRDLTLAEARQAITDWLDPDGALGDDAVLAFEE